MAKGGYKGSSPARETSPEEYSGVWDIVEQYGEQKAGSWPFQADDCAPKSLRFNSADQASLSTTIPNITTFSISFWYKHVALTRSDIFVTDSSYGFFFYQHTDGRFKLNNNTVNLFESNGYYRDPCAWYHCLLTNDGTTLKLYVNGVLDKAQTVGTFLNSGGFYIGRDRASANNWGDFYLAELNFIDGQALTPDAFTFIDGQGILQPKRFTGDYSSGPVYSSGLTASNGYHGSYPAHLAFDGSTATRAGNNQSSGGGTLTLTKNITVANQIRVLTGIQNTVKINGTSIGTATGSDPAYVVSNAAYDVTEIVIEAPNSNGYRADLFAIEVDGVLLTDAVVGRNSFHLDFSQDEVGKAKDQSGIGNDWTTVNIGGPVKGLIAGITINAPSNVTLQTAAVQNMFNGNKDNYTYAHTNDATNYIQWTPTGGYPTNGHIWIQGGDGNGAGANTMEVQINGSVVSRSAVVDNETYSQAGYGWGDWHKYPVAGNTLTSLRLTGVYALIRQLSTVEDPTHSVLGISDDNDVPAITDTLASATDYFVDSPVNGNEASTGAGNERRGNYCVMNPLNAPGCTLTDGNLKISCGSSKNGRGTVWPSSGKWYFEFDITTYGNPYVGIGSHGLPQHYVSKNSIAINNTGHIYVSTDGAQTYPGYSVALNATGSYMCAFDLDNGKIWWGKDGTWYKQHTSANTTTTKAQVEAGNDGTDFSGHQNFGQEWTVQFGTSSNTSAYELNTGQKPFKYPSSVPSGFSPIATSFLPEPSDLVKVPTEAVDVALWNGTGSPQTISLGFNPDLIWTKTRSHAVDHKLVDAVRGFSKYLEPNQTRAELTDSNGVTGSSSTGFTVGTSTDFNNANSRTYCGWVWDAGEATTTISAGGLNSSAYDQSQVWSSGGGSGLYTGSNWTGTFDGTPAANGNDIAQSAYVSNSGSSQLTFGTAISGRLKVTTTQGSNNVSTGNNRPTVTLSDGTVLRVSAPTSTPEVLDFGTVSGITTLTIAGTSTSGMNLISVELGGKLLADNGVSVTNVPSTAADVRARPDAGFSVVFWQAQSSAVTVPHGIDQPEFIIMKSNNTAGSPWLIYHEALGSSYYLDFSNAAASANNLVYTNAPTPHEFSPGNGIVNTSSYGQMIAYCWSGVEGFSKFGSFQNPSSSEGAFVFLGFKPALIIAKCVLNISSSSGAGDWIIKDSSRSPFNNPSDGNTLSATVANAEDDYYAATQAAIDILSNGFKIRHPNSSPLGDPGRLFIYAAWAENPFASNNRAV